MLTFVYNAHKNNNYNNDYNNNGKRVIGIAQLCLSAVLKTENISLNGEDFAAQHGTLLRSEGKCLPKLILFKNIIIIIINWQRC